MGRSAAQFWGMLELREELPHFVEVGRPSGSAKRSLKGLGPELRNTQLHFRQRTFREGEVVMKDWIPVTTPVRTQVDLAGSFGWMDLSRCFTEACRLRLIRKRDLAALLDCCQGLAGAPQIRRLTGWWLPELERTRSPLEGRYLLEWTARDRRVPEVNVPLGVWEVDFLWRTEKLIVEVDGRAYHDHEIARHRDARKDSWLHSQGYSVLRFGHADVHEHAQRTCEVVQTHLDAA